MGDAVQNQAGEIAKSVFDTVSAALVTHDFDLYRSVVRVPFIIATNGVAQHHGTEHALEKGFDGVCKRIADAQITEVKTQVIGAFFDAPDRIRVCYSGRITSKDRQIQPPSFNVGFLQKTEGTWFYRMAVVTGPEPEKPSTVFTMFPPEQGSTDAEDDPGRVPMGLFQTQLDRVTQAYIEGNFDALARAIRLPLFLQGSELSHVFTNYDDVREDFERHQTDFRVHGVTDIVRTVKSAQFVTPNILHGAYRTHVLSGSELVIPSYFSAILLEREPHLGWQISAILHPMGHLTLQRVNQQKNNPSFPDAP